MMKFYTNFLLITLFLFSIVSNAQSEQESSELKERHHSLQFLLGHTQIQEAINEDGKRAWLSVPSFELNYNFEINEKWAIGLHTDIVIEDFSVETFSEDNKVIERSSPIAPAIVTSFKFCNHFSALLGLGGEFSKEENFMLIRIGIEYGYEFHKNWELVSNLTNDSKFNAYNSFSFGIGIARKL
ncbi:hypothetical protein [Xanthomarina sp. GH4-25]|uniref:hypothetical protein n=1 Tax=Xanthomarina sp. GH4-25 TaxID=3349335 RepID=UPI003877ED10